MENSAMRKSIFRAVLLGGLLIALVPLLKVVASPKPGDHEANWMTDYSAALAKAKAENKPVVLNFTGSDWCPPCKFMHAEVLTQKEFVEYADQNVVLLYVDFPRRKRLDEEQQVHNFRLADKYRIQGYPTFVLLDPNGQEVSRLFGLLAENPEEFINWIRAGSAAPAAQM